jgi:hypothetical protein
MTFVFETFQFDDLCSINFQLYDLFSITDVRQLKDSITEVIYYKVSIIVVT